MAKNFFKFSIGALGLIATSLIVFYFLERAKYEREGTAMEGEIETANISEAIFHQ